MPQTRIKDDRTKRELPDSEAPGDSDNRRRESARQPRENWLRQHPYVVAVSILVILLVLIGVVIWWLNARHYETTDDAFVDARNVSISSQVTGSIINVPVTDNQLVSAGALLVEIDPRDYDVAVAQGKAQVDQANAMIANLDAQIETQKARVDQAEKQLAQTKAAEVFAKQENDRAQDLVRRGAGTQQQAQQNASNLTQAQANVASADANAEAAKKQILVLETQRKNAAGQLELAQAALTQAQTNLQRTSITAPESGRATKITAAIGANAQPGQVLMVFVPERKWITANFKETQLTAMRPGQPVDIEIDAYPDRVFHAHVDSIQAGSGAAFSLLPPENATGNFVKVVQRVPVKILFDDPPDVYIGPGMSVVPRVKVR